MRNKLAKALRKEALKHTVGMKEIAYTEAKPPTYIYDEVSQSYIKATKGVPTKLRVCTRHLYKEMKKNLRGTK